MRTFRDDIHRGSKVPLVKSDDIDDEAITEEKLADNAVTESKIKDKSVSLAKLSEEASNELATQAAKKIEEKVVFYDTIEKI